MRFCQPRKSFLPVGPAQIRAFKRRAGNRHVPSTCQREAGRHHGRSGERKFEGHALCDFRRICALLQVPDFEGDVHERVQVRHLQDLLAVRPERHPLPALRHGLRQRELSGYELRDRGYNFRPLWQRDLLLRVGRDLGGCRVWRPQVRHLHVLLVGRDSWRTNGISPFRNFRETGKRIRTLLVQHGAGLQDRLPDKPSRMPGSGWEQMDCQQMGQMAGTVAAT